MNLYRGWHSNTETGIEMYAKQLDEKPREESLNPHEGSLNDNN